MDTQTGPRRPPSLNMNQTQATQTNTYDVSNRPSTSAGSTPLSSTPATPSLHTPTARRPSHPATSPLNATSPDPAKTIRRASSAIGLNQRPPSSPKLMRKSSRTSLGAQPEEIEKRATPKRSISNLITGLREAHSKMEPIEEPIPLTAPQIAMEHFARELAAHSRPESAAETVVIFHDACYGHRYSRLKTTKSTLSMIVERPERMHASVLGACTAYVRLGGHHAESRNAPHPNKAEVSPPAFNIRRTGREMSITSPYVTNVHGTAWMNELRAMCNVAGEKVAAGAKELSRGATPTEQEKRKLHEGDLYLCSESLNAFQGALGGVAEAVDSIFTPAAETRRAFVAVRPPGHHCSADHPSGFCWLNNVHVGIEYAAQTYGLTHAAILDFDLHHGDGSQAITWERNSKNNEKRLNAKPNSKLKFSPDIGYYSLHDINSYPCEMGDDEKVQAASLCITNAHGQSIWNVHLEEWKTEDDFWQLYETKYRVLLDKARGFLRHHTARLRAEGKTVAKSAVFISAGFDASEWESAGMQRHKVNVPTEFYARFTRDVVQLAQEEGTGCDGRVVSVLEGGYSDRALCSGVLSHLSGLCATPVDSVKADTSDSIPLDQMMRGLGINGTTSNALRYEKDWWSAANLTALELKVNPPPPAQAKKMRIGQQPTYATPTESFAYKVVDTDKFARSISGTMRDVSRPERPPTPPPPEVDWVIATQELSKLLIPTDRPTESCTPEELAGVKTKKERMSTIPAVGADESTKPRQLRDRKAKAPAYAGSSHSDELASLRSVSRSSRRQTIADLPPSSDPPESSHQRRASRRLSAGSALSSVNDDLDPAPPPVPSIPVAAPRANGSMKPPPAPAAGVQVKKTRVPAPKPKKTTISSAPVSPSRSTKAPVPFAEPSTGVGAAANDDVDALTSGMKKVTLKVGSKEEHDRKQKEKVDAERRARGLKAAETRKANAAKKAAKETAVPATKSASGLLAAPAKENTAPAPALPGDPQTQHFAPAEILYRAPSVAPPSGAPMPAYAVSTMPVASTLPAASAQMSEMGQYQPQGQWFSNEASPIPAEQPLSYVPDSAARQLIHENNVANEPQSLFFASDGTPIRPSSREQLPVWSSTGAIPFAPPFSSQQHSNGFSDVNMDGRANMNNTGIAPTGIKDESMAGEPSVWDVPETPQR